VNPRSLALCVLAVAASWLCAACDDLSEFRGQFAGDIVSGSFIRDCFGPEVTATLVFDPDYAVAPLPDDLPPAQQNRLTTSDGTFKDTVLTPINALPHDPLGQLDFPGSRRLRNFMLLARPDEGPLAGRDAVVVVSLMEKKRIELRVIARSGSDGACAPEEGDAGVEAEPPQPGEAREFFGLFHLKGS
jgi:hypothetical protein